MPSRTHRCSSPSAGRLADMGPVASQSLAAIARSCGGEHHEVYRAALGLAGELAEVDDDAAGAALVEKRPLTGDARSDALLAALAEHVAFHRRLAPLAWVERPERFLPTAWFPVDLPVLRVCGLVSCPASFARRGIFIDPTDLQRV